MKKAGYFSLIALVVILGYDFYLFFEGGTQNTISWYLYEASYEHPFIAFLTGFVCGHLFWQMKKPKEEAPDEKK
jgi:hypothetical protein